MTLLEMPINIHECVVYEAVAHILEMCYEHMSGCRTLWADMKEIFWSCPLNKVKSGFMLAFDDLFSSCILAVCTKPPNSKNDSRVLAVF